MPSSFPSLLLSQNPLASAPVETQQIGLAQGWNLISVQVETTGEAQDFFVNRSTQNAWVGWFN